MNCSLRTLVVGLIVTAMSIPPAAAWHCCGTSGPVYYEPMYDACCGEVIVYDDCGGCDSCHGAPSDAMHEDVPAPADTQPAPAPPQETQDVERPLEGPPSVPSIPPAVEPEDSFNGAEETAPPAPVEQPEPPAEEPADLFGEPPATPPPVDMPPAEEPANEPAEVPADEPVDLFGEPAETETEMPAEEPVDEEPAEETPAEEQPAEEDLDIFGASRAVLREPGGLASDEMRTWVDNTGNYSCRGRLVSLLEGHVRLLKDNGRTTTVPLSRLSENDLQFVDRQASAGGGEAFHTAQR